MGEPRNKRITDTMLDTNIFVPGVPYNIQDIYDKVARNTKLYQEDFEEDTTGPKWQHTVRRLLEEVNGNRSIGNRRDIEYNGNSEYTFL